MEKVRTEREMATKLKKSHQKKFWLRINRHLKKLINGNDQKCLTNFKVRARYIVNSDAIIESNDVTDIDRLREPRVTASLTR